MDTANNAARRVAADLCLDLCLDHGMPPQVAGWLAGFHRALLDGVSTFERHITHGGFEAEDPEHCGCDNETIGSPGLAWFHENHRLYNRAQKRLIAATIGLVAFREILDRDLKVKDSDLGPEWGNLLRKDYARDIITHFVDSDDWC